MMKFPLFGLSSAEVKFWTGNTSKNLRNINTVDETSETHFSHHLLFHMRLLSPGQV